MSKTGPRLTPRRLVALQQAASDAKGGIPTRDLAAGDIEALEQLGFAASIDDCGHINTSPPPGGYTPEGHDFHPHFLRITPAGCAAVQAAGPAPREMTPEP